LTILIFYNKVILRGVMGKADLKTVFLFNNKSLIADRCVVGDSFMVRLRGLIGKKNLDTREALWLPRCSSIHMWFMKIPIDVIFLKKIKNKNSENKIYFKISSLRSDVKPWKILPLQDLFSSDVIELKAGQINKLNIKKGDTLCIEFSS